LLSYVTNNGKNFSALIFGDSPTAVEFITLLTEQGTRVPDDLAVISYDYFPYSRHLRIPLTTIVQPIESLVTEAVSLVQNRLENPGSRYIHKTLKHRILPGESA
jgi:LacI family transcriptional regulator